ncbi:MAG: AAA family ATPase, partial [Lachnospiraceae bacterium]|nr:AAA family ATPase [Lachnospiraceae bacterium]
MRRKIYDTLLEWKRRSRQTALLIDGARRVGKSYIAEKFARENFKSCILIDFNRASRQVQELFENYLDDLDTF